MNAYIYKAALICEDCCQEVKESLHGTNKEPINPNDEYSYDSDDYPKGPYCDGGGDADCPNHCDICHVFLENPLTSDGEDYVKECHNHNGVWKEWKEFYSYLFD